MTPRWLALTLCVLPALTMAQTTAGIAPLPGQSLPGADAAGPGLDRETRLRIGFTGILCVTTPCPSYGIALADKYSPSLGTILWWGDVLPDVLAQETIAAEVRKAWDQGQCLIVKGRLSSAGVDVSEIEGNC